MVKKLWYTYFGIYLTLMSTYKFKMKSLKKKSAEKAEEYVFSKAKKLSDHVLKKSKTVTEVSGLENIPDETCVFIANHQAIFDGFMLFSFINKKFAFIAKKEIKKIPLIGTWMTDLNTVFIDRGNPRASVQAINEGVQKLKEGYSMAIFPEGTRSLSSEIGTFKKGSMKLAIKAGVPIVPITIDGTYRILETGNKVTGNKVKMIVHKPIYIDKLSKEEQKNLVDKVQNIIEEAL